eukprot:scaffold103828_cov36-Tisochrysis_lutea.AAC.1
MASIGSSARGVPRPSGSHERPLDHSSLEKVLGSVMPPNSHILLASGPVSVCSADASAARPAGTVGPAVAAKSVAHVTTESARTCQLSEE